MILRRIIWNEQIEERGREQLYLERIASELDNTIREIEDAVVTARYRQELGEFLILGGYTDLPMVRSHAFDEMQSAGELNLLRDTELRFDLTEFYTDISGNAQWGYLRELGQTE